MNDSQNDYTDNYNGNIDETLNHIGRLLLAGTLLLNLDGSGPSSRPMILFQCIPVVSSAASDVVLSRGRAEVGGRGCKSDRCLVLRSRFIENQRGKTLLSRDCTDYIGVFIYVVYLSVPALVSFCFSSACAALLSDRFNFHSLHLAYVTPFIRMQVPPTSG